MAFRLMQPSVCPRSRQKQSARLVCMKSMTVWTHRLPDPSNRFDWRHYMLGGLYDRPVAQRSRTHFADLPWDVWSLQHFNTGKSNRTPRGRDVPKLRMHRKASIRRPSIDDLGGLLLKDKLPRIEERSRAANAIAWELNSAHSIGPISLASSPYLTPPAPEKEDKEVQA